MPSHNDKDLNEIIAEFDRTSPLEASTVRRWMRTTDLEVAGALMSLIAKHDSRINAAIRPEEYFDFVRGYYERSMLENPDGEWSDSTTTAGYDFARWFLRLWDDPSVPRSAINDLKESLAQVCRAAPELVRANIINSALEQLFRRSEILDFFADWQGHPSLSEPYIEAKRLAELHQKSHSRNTRCDS